MFLGLRTTKISISPLAHNYLHKAHVGSEQSIVLTLSASFFNFVSVDKVNFLRVSSDQSGSVPSLKLRLSVPLKSMFLIDFEY